MAIRLRNFDVLIATQPGLRLPTQTKQPRLMKKISSLITIALCAMILTLWSGAARAQTPPPTPWYSVTGTNGTGGGTTNFSLPPVNAPVGSTTLSNLTFQRAQAAKTEIEGLSPREGEVLELLAHGFLYKEIAESLQISVPTVNTYTV